MSTCSGDGTKCLRFADKVAIVTGGCDGIGRGCVEELVANGGKVAVLDVNDEIGVTLKAGKVGEIVYIHCDMREEDQIKNAIEKAMERFGRLDCLVNNVGTILEIGHIDDLTVQGFKDVLNINVVSGFTATKYSIPYLRKSKGCVVSMSSTQSTITNKSFSTYCATKGDIRSMTMALANDEGENGVRFNCIAAGYTRTPLFESLVSKEDQLMFANTSTLNRLCTVEEVAKLCLFLATDGTFMTGTEVMCCGGLDVKVGVRVPGHPYT